MTTNLQFSVKDFSSLLVSVIPKGRLLHLEALRQNNGIVVLGTFLVKKENSSSQELSLQMSMWLENLGTNQLLLVFIT